MTATLTRPRFSPLTNATIALLDQLDAEHAWNVRNRVHELAQELDDVQRAGLAWLLDEITDAVRADGS